MQISLISPYGSISNLGLRIISAVLREAGFRTQMVFLPMPSSDSPWNLSPHFQLEYPENLLSQLTDLTKNSRIIGLSLMNIYKEVGIQITRALRRENNLIVLGGIFPTLHPDEVLQYADGACIGDGEYAMLELAKKLDSNQPIDSIPNLWFRGKSYPQLKSVPDISALPLPDFGPEEHFIYLEEEASLVPLTTYEDYKKHFDRRPDLSGKLTHIYRLQTTRGCPHNCTYCNNNALKKVQTQVVRYRSIEWIKRELLFVRDKFPFVGLISIEDDTFTARKDVIEVARLLKEFNYPFRCLISPLNVSEELIKNLVECGLFFCFVGLQSRAQRIEALYNRTNLNREIDKLFEIFKINYPHIPLLVDILIDNPYEKTEETLYTLHYLLDHLPPNAVFGVNSLVFYKGTKLWEKALEDKILNYQHDLKTWHWHRQKKIYYTTLLFILLKLRLSRSFIRFLSTKPFILLFERSLFNSKLFPWIIQTIKKVYIRLGKKPRVFPMQECINRGRIIPVLIIRLRRILPWRITL